MDLNSGDSVQQRRYVDVIDFDKNGHRVIVGWMDLFAHKECPSCYLMFKRSDCINCLKRENKPDTYFYRCPCCKCRVKAFQEDITNYM